VSIADLLSNREMIESPVIFRLSAANFKKVGAGTTLCAFQKWRADPFAIDVPHLLGRRPA
jgi:hypothetical protein